MQTSIIVKLSNELILKTATEIANANNGRHSGFWANQADMGAAINATYRSAVNHAMGAEQDRVQAQPMFGAVQPFNGYITSDRIRISLSDNVYSALTFGASQTVCVSINTIVSALASGSPVAEFWAEANEPLREELLKSGFGLVYRVLECRLNGTDIGTLPIWEATPNAGYIYNMHELIGAALRSTITFSPEMAKSVVVQEAQTLALGQRAVVNTSSTAYSALQLLKLAGVHQERYIVRINVHGSNENFFTKPSFYFYDLATNSRVEPSEDLNEFILNPKSF